MNIPQFVPATLPIVTPNLCTLPLQTDQSSTTDLSSSTNVPDYQSIYEQLNKASADQAFNVQTLATVAHRFGDIECPEETAIKVGDRYIHANYVGKGIGGRVFVAAQLPMLESQETFWQFVMNTNCAIVDLTNSADSEGEERYYPETTERPRILGSVHITLLEESASETESCTTYQALSETISTTITRYHYQGWLDRRTIRLDEIEKLTLKLASFSGLVLVHCRAGVGRTGTIIAAYFLKELIAQKIITKENYLTEIPNLILALRKQRGQSFVATEEQFRSLMEYGRNLLEECIL